MSAETIITLEPWKRQAVEAYSGAMCAQLMREENQAKNGWEDADVEKLMHEVWYHAAKLLKAIEVLRDREVNINKTGNHGVREAKIALLEFAADVGNCAMMVAEVTGALELIEDPSVGEDGESKIDWQVTSSGGSP